MRMAARFAVAVQYHHNARREYVKEIAATGLLDAVFLFEELRRFVSSVTVSEYLIGSEVLTLRRPTTDSGTTRRRSSARCVTKGKNRRRQRKKVAILSNVEIDVL
ncbi:hypothetical protein EVAR_11966_1 [Eumeta japonica]|uniref:Uncharacterized protein n=1 Tax=Eumeta variegata TaxID=151549 RepID=A0A4C1U5H4_EUMVA|nr:hypothetical protein EVAR_11966_1 [Eumeta japonica]